MTLRVKQLSVHLLTLFLFFCTTQTHQEQNVQYEEICNPIMERCRFLFKELRPAIGNEVLALKRLKILNTPPRWKNVVHHMIRTRRTEAATALGNGRNISIEIMLMH